MFGYILDIASEEIEVSKTRQIAEKDVKFLSLMFRLAGLVKATDQRDWAYSMVLRDLKRPLIKPDYSLSESQVYIQAAQSFIQAGEDLMSLALFRSPSDGQAYCHEYQSGHREVSPRKAAFSTRRAELVQGMPLTRSGRVYTAVRIDTDRCAGASR